MRRFATMFALAAAAVLPAQAQTTKTFDVTVKQIFAVSQDSLVKAQQLQTAGTLNTAIFQRLVTSRYFDRSSNGASTSDTLVRFTGVLLSDPLSSGLASAGANPPGRVHVFVRDVAAAADPAGLKGYVIQVVDGNYAGDGLKQLAPGAVVTFTGVIGYFSGAVQFAPTANPVVVTQNYRSLYPDALGRPITLAVEDLNKPATADPASNNPQATLNFANFPNNAAEYVRLENLQVETNSVFNNTRFNVTYANLARTVFVYQNDVSLRYRNDRNTDQGYINNGFNVRTTNYVPPAVGSRVTVEGFTQPYLSDFVNYFNPNVSINVSPIEDGDVTVTAGAPGVASLTTTSAVVRGTSAETITVSVQPAPGATVSTVTLFYRRAGTAQYQSVNLTAGTPTASGTPYSGQIPASALSTDGSFIQYYVRATDNQNRGTDSPVQTFRVLANGVRKIEHIQRTVDGGVGNSPFTGTAFTAASPFELNAVVMSRPDTSGFVSIQDDPALGAFSGIVLEATAGNTVLRRGDQIRITAATVAESNGQTRLTGVTYTKTGTGTPYAYKEVTTTQLADPATAEAHEGMMLKFNNVTVTSTNADAPSNFGEFLIRSAGATETVRVNDFSNAVPNTFSTTLRTGVTYRYVQGLWDYSFSNFKLEPEVPSDLGGTTNGTAVAGEDAAAGLALLAPVPNPARGLATLAYRTGKTAEVQIEVLDLMGRRVALLAEGLVVPGDHTATLATADLAAGLYVVRLSQGAAAVTRPLVVVK